ncbi:MAG: hypothetical protein Ct9H90mP2_03370 [Dehalococcoidia bacterium]|nr:MAG: hypothetical protein Ct9H90mP2_03370 [Dehalococcoidia bacterium]
MLFIAKSLGLFIFIPSKLSTTVSLDPSKLYFAIRLLPPSQANNSPFILKFNPFASPVSLKISLIVLFFMLKLSTLLCEMLEKSKFSPSQQGPSVIFPKNLVLSY